MRISDLLESLTHEEQELRRSAIEYMLLLDHGTAEGQRLAGKTLAADLEGSSKTQVMRALLTLTKDTRKSVRELPMQRLISFMRDHDAAKAPTKEEERAILKSLHASRTPPGTR